jgi:hypothetical protein
MKKRFGFIKVTRIYRSILLYSLHIDCTDGEFEKQAFFPNKKRPSGAIYLVHKRVKELSLPGIQRVLPGIVTGKV